MSASLKSRPKQAEKVTRFQLPRKLGFLLDPHPYKVAYSGRHGLKSRAFSGALLTEGIQVSHRVLCAREVQKSLVESCHQTLVDQIKRLDYSDYYSITDNAIRCRHNDTLFRFAGLSDQTAESMKSYEGFTRFWGEEAQAFTKRSLQIALPTIFRTPGAEAWFSFNPYLDTDEVWQRFVVNTPPGAVVVRMNYRDAIACGWWNDEQEALRQFDLVHSKDEYQNIWEGVPRTSVIGAIYGGEITEMVTGGRFRPMPYDPRLPVHRIWDLGWNDLMTVIMVQKPHPSALNIVNYIEDSHITYTELLATMDQLRYAWGTDWMPHDAEQHDPKSGTNARKLLVQHGRKVQIMPKSDAEARIRAARMMFPRIYMDTSRFDTPPERPNRLLGAGHLMERLKRYKRNVPKTTGEPTGPTHDENSHGADAYGGLAEIVDRIRNEGEMPKATVPAFRNFDASLGLLG